MVFYSPESIKVEATGEILERLQLLLNNKEKEEPYAIELFNHSLFIERIKLYNDKTLLGLKKEKKVLEEYISHVARLKLHLLDGLALSLVSFSSSRSR